MQYNDFSLLKDNFFFIGNLAHTNLKKKRTIIHSVIKRLTVTIAFTFLCGPVKTNQRLDV